MDKSIAVFIPVYNGEAYLAKTVESLKKQKYRNFSVYLVDDSSTDNSFQLLCSLISDDKRFKLFQKVNGGSTANSWNFILPKIEEDFIFYMSQDDLISDDIFLHLIRRQKETAADCVLPDLVFYYGECANGRELVGIDGDRDIIVSGRKAFIESLYWNVHGFALRKRELYNGEFFYEDAFDTDEYMTRKLFHKSKKVAFSQGKYFYRQNNPNAITKTIGYKNYFRILTFIRVYQIIKLERQLKHEKNSWYKMMILNYFVILKKFFQERVILNPRQKKEIGDLLKNSGKFLLFEAFSLNYIQIFRRFVSRY